jgi:hypothetical protein
MMERQCFVSQLEPSLNTMGAIADAIGHNVTRGYNINSPKKLKIASGMRLPLQLNFSHSAGNESYHLVAWKLSGDVYIAVAYEPGGSDVTTIIMLNKPVLLKEERDKNISNYVMRLEKEKLIESLDDYISAMKHGVMCAAFRRGSTGAFTKLDISEL